MSNIAIDVNELTKEIDKIKEEKKNLEELLNSLSKDTDELKDYWQTETSDEVFISFEEFKDHFENLIELLNNDINYLEKNVKVDYENYEEVTNKEIDTNIAV